MGPTTMRSAAASVRSIPGAGIHRRRRRSHRALHLVPPNAVAPRVTPYLRIIKPAIDRSIGMLLLLLCLPVFLLVAASVALTSGGAVLERQRRVGLGGEPFDLLRFRTTPPVPGPGAGRARTRGYGARIGRWVDRSGLAGLPCLVNLVRGEISLVGPKAQRPDVVEGYDTWELLRHAVRPGLTGLWRVDPRGNGSRGHDAALDTVYVGTAGARVDLGILLRTPWAIVRDR